MHFKSRTYILNPDHIYSILTLIDYILNHPIIYTIPIIYNSIPTLLALNFAIIYYILNPDHIYSIPTLIDYIINPGHIYSIPIIYTQSRHYLQSIPIIYTQSQTYILNPKHIY